MPKILSKPKRDAGPQATLCKLEDARTLITRIREAIDREIDRRVDDRGRADVGWKHFGDAARLLEELKDVGHWLLIDRNEVGDDDGCPVCGTRDVDRLRLDGNEVHCTTCGCEYELV